MKCWRCGKEIDDNSGECIYCHAGQHRSVPATKEGAALRELYDHYGADIVFGNPVFLVNGFGDLVSDTLSVDVKKIKNNLKAATDAGIGKLYLEQLSIGSPAPDFDARVKKVLTEDADMNEKAADRLIGWFDEMIGWKLTKAEPQNPVVIPQPKNEPKTETPPPLPAQPKPKKLPAWIWITVLLAVGILGYFMYQNNQLKEQILKMQTAQVLTQRTQVAIFATLTKAAELTPTPQPTATKVPTNTPVPSGARVSDTDDVVELAEAVVVPYSVRVGDTVTFGSYKQDEYSLADPIEWLVLAVENGRALLLSKYALEAKPYYSNSFTDITWEKSDLRIWLNGKFYYNAFSSSEKARIQEVWNNNPNNPDNGTLGGNDKKIRSSS